MENSSIHVPNRQPVMVKDGKKPPNMRQSDLVCDAIPASVLAWSQQKTLGSGCSGNQTLSQLMSFSSELGIVDMFDYCEDTDNLRLRTC